MLASIPERGARRHESFLDLSQLGWPEFILCAEGIVLLLTLFFVPWFSTTDTAASTVTAAMSRAGRPTRS
jgi:hypothetical protein